MTTNSAASAENVVKRTAFQFQFWATSPILGYGGSPQILACDIAAKPLPDVSIYDRKSIEVNQQRRNWYSVQCCFFVDGGWVVVSSRSRRQPPAPPTKNPSWQKSAFHMTLLLTLCERNSTETSGYDRRDSNAGLDIFCLVSLNKLLIKESSYQWSVMQWPSYHFTVM